MYFRLTDENKENQGVRIILYVPTYVVFNYYTVLIEMLVVATLPIKNPVHFSDPLSALRTVGQGGIHDVCSSVR